MRALVSDQHRRINSLKAWVQDYREQCGAELSNQHFQMLDQHIRTVTEKTSRHMTGVLRRRIGNLRESRSDTLPHRLVYNLSSRTLTHPQVLLLQRDVGYNLMDARALDFIAALEPAVSRISTGEEAKNSLKQQITGLLMAHRDYQTLSRREAEALKQLKRDDSIIILPADKGRATVVMDKVTYISKALNLLDDRTAYRVVAKDPIVTLRNHTNKLLDSIKSGRRMSEDMLRRIRPGDSALARFYGLPKIHKANVPLRPIVAFRGTPTSALARWLSHRLSHLANDNVNTVRSAEEFLERIKTLRVERDELMVSFDIVSLFTSIPQELAITILRDRLNQGNLEHQDSLRTEDLMKLVEVCLKTYFTFQGTTYEQIKGTPMGSPISSVIAEVVLQQLEHIAMAQYRPKFWARYVDDTFVVIKKDRKTDFMSILNSVYPDIQFTMEEENQGSLAFLDVLVHRQPDGALDTRVYRKPTCTDRILNYNSNHPVAHKVSCIRALFKRVDSHCSTVRAKVEERDHLYRVCKYNGYPTRFVRRHSVPPERRGNLRTEETTPQTTLVTLPYINNVSEATARLLAPYNIRVAHRPNQTLRAAIMRPKDPLSDMDKSAVVYRINCGDCPSNYVGETAKRVRTRVHEHKLAVRRGEQYSQIATHMMESGHRFDFDKVSVLASDSTKGGRLLKEAWLSDEDSINRHIDLCPAHLTLRAWSQKNLPSRWKRPATMTGTPNTRITENSLPPSQLMGIRTSHEQHPSTPSPSLGMVEYPRIPRAGPKGAGDIPPRMRFDFPPPPLEHRRRGVPSRERSAAGDITTMRLGILPDLGREKATSPTMTVPPMRTQTAITTQVPWQEMRNNASVNGHLKVAENGKVETEGADTPDCHREGVDGEPDEIGTQGTGNEGIDKSARREGVTTRSSLRRRERTLAPTPVGVMLNTCLPRLITSACQRQQAARKDARAGETHTKRAREVEDVVRAGTPHGCAGAPRDHECEDEAFEKEGRYAPDGTGVQHTSSEGTDQSEYHGGVITRLSLRKKERMPISVPADLTLGTRLPRSITSTYQRQQAARKDVRAGEVHTREAREVENVVGVCTPCGDDRAPHGRDRGDRAYEAEGCGDMIECSRPRGGGNGVNNVEGGDAQSDAMGKVIKVKEEGGITPDFAPDKKQTPAAAFTGRRRKRAAIINSQPVIDKQLVPSGPMTRSRSRVQIPAKP